jgi:phosphoribosylamine--glycine ligase
MKKKVLVFASGNGSNFQAIVEYFKKTDKEVYFELLTDRPCFALERAKKLGVKTHLVPFKDTYNFLLNAPKFDLYVLAGYMRILPCEVLDFGTFINIHPSLLPKFKGVDAIRKAYEAKEKESGVTVHYVTDELDSGKTIIQTKIDIEGMSFKKLEETIHKIEHQIYAPAVEKILREQYEKYNVLLVGSGAREHALAWKIKASPLLKKLYLANPNDGFKELGEEITFKNYKDLAHKARALCVDLAVIGPEIPLAEGIVDVLKGKKIKCIGPDKKWAQMESSKAYAKAFMEKYSIPTAKYKLIKDKKKIDEVLSHFDTPPVIKADGLAAGKGVHVSTSFEDAKQTLEEFLTGRFRDASKKVVVEEKLEGEELSVIAIYDGETILPFVGARDYKRLKEDNQGPNTGGMGAYCPVALTDEQKEGLKNYLDKLQDALKREKARFCGIIYSGLMLTKKGIKVLEYNMRFGDPETQPLMMHLKSDILEVFMDAAKKELKGTTLEFGKGNSICVVAAAEGYPDNPKKGCEIKGIENIKKKFGVEIFFAGVKKAGDNELFSSGGRVLSVCKSGARAREDIYKALDELDFKDKIFRNDIAQGIEGK